MHLLFYLILFCLSSASAYCQINGDGVNEDNQKVNHPKMTYLGITSGVVPSSFRDFATSPLFYQGEPLHFGLGHLEMSPKRESSIRVSYTFGKFSSPSLTSDIKSDVKIITVNYHELFELSPLSSKKLNVKIGGKLLSTINIRANNSFGNNSTGFEVISNLCFSAKGTRSFEFGKKNFKNNLSLGLNMGLVNTAFRNKYIYTSHAPLLNEDNIYDGYELTLFTGFRFNSTLAYTFWLKNNNGLRLSYEWDIYGTGQGTNRFEMAAHFINLALLFNLNSSK